MQHQERNCRQWLPFECNQSLDKRLHGDDIRIVKIVHRQSAGGDSNQKCKHQVIGKTADVAYPVNQEATAPQPGKADQHCRRGVISDGLYRQHPGPHRISKINKDGGARVAALNNEISIQKTKSIYLP